MIFLLNFAWYWFVFLYRTDTNPVLKHLVFVKTLKKKKMCLAFLHMAEFLKDKIKKSYFILKKGVLACNLTLITSLLKS